MANLLGRKWRTVRRFPAQRASGIMCVALVPLGQMAREPCGQPPLGPDGGRRRPRNTLSRGSAVGIVLEDWYWCLLTHSSSEWGFSKGESSEGRTKVLHGPQTQTYGKTNNF